MHRVLKIWGVVVLFAMAQAASAEAGFEFPDGEQVSLQQMQANHYRLVISELKRTRATTYGEQEQRLSGQLTRTVWAVDSGLSLAETITQLSTQLSNHEMIYQCQGLDCGSSHFWANEIFGNARLVTRGPNQFYSVSVQELSNPSLPSQKYRVQVLYLIQRGTGQILLNLDELLTSTDPRPKASSKQSLIDQLDNPQGWLTHFVIEQGRLELQASQPLIQALSSLDPKDAKRRYLVVHFYTSADIRENQACSERLARQLQTALKNSYLSIIGQGALVAPPDESSQYALRFISWPRS